MFGGQAVDLADGILPTLGGPVGGVAGAEQQFGQTGGGTSQRGAEVAAIREGGGGLDWFGFRVKLAGATINGVSCLPLFLGGEAARLGGFFQDFRQAFAGARQLGAKFRAGLGRRVRIIHCFHTQPRILHRFGKKARFSETGNALGERLKSLKCYNMQCSNWLHMI